MVGYVQISQYFNAFNIVYENFWGIYEISFTHFLNVSLAY